MTPEMTAPESLDVAAMLAAVAPYATQGRMLDPGHAALLVIDMQEFFADIAVPVLPMVNALVTAARAEDIAVIYTRHGHRDLAVDGGVLASWWEDDLAMVGTPAWELLVGLAPRPGELVIDKTRYSAFHGTNLLTELRAQGITDIVICGVMTNCCCETTARDAFMNDFSVFVAADATATANADLHVSSLKGMSYACARVAATAQLVAQMH